MDVERREMDKKVFAHWLDEIAEACREIADCDLCGECPMRVYCIEETPFADIAYECPQDTFEEIIKMGNDPRWYVASDDERDEMRAKW